MTHSVIESDLHDYQNRLLIHFLKKYLFIVVGSLLLLLSWSLGMGSGCMNFSSCSTQHSVLRSCGTWA